MEKNSWVCTLITQLSLCFGLFIALNIGRPQSQTPIYQKKTRERSSLDMHFISVRGGSRPLTEQTHLLKQVEKVAKTYEAKFVVHISELGEKDPLMQNATRRFQSLKVPWYTTRACGYTTRALKRQGADYFLKQVKISNGKTLDLIALDTGSLQDPSSGAGSDQLQWLTRILEASTSNWRIVVGFHPMVSCDRNIERNETKQVSGSLYNIFLRYGVNAYLSGQDCANLMREGDTTQISNAGSVDKGPYFTPINKRVISHKEILSGFLLHRVSSLEIVAYFISLTGELVHKIVVQQWGKEVM